MAGLRGGMETEPIGGRWLPAVLAFLFRVWSAPWRVRVENPELLDAALAKGPVIFAFWHGEQLALLRAHAHRGFLALVSWSRDGELLARVLPRFGYAVARGSTSRGAREGWLACREALARGQSPALAVDGPRGPRHAPQRGALTLAAASGAPVLCVVCTARPVLRLRSWDRFEIPLPWARVTVRYGLHRVDPACTDADTQALGDTLERLTERGSRPRGPGTARPS